MGNWRWTNDDTQTTKQDMETMDMQRYETNYRGVGQNKSTLIEWKKHESNWTYE